MDIEKLNEELRRVTQRLDFLIRYTVEETEER